MNKFHNIRQLGFFLFLFSVFTPILPSQVKIKENVVIQPGTLLQRKTAEVANLRFVYRCSLDRDVRIYVFRDQEEGQLVYGHQTVETSISGPVEGTYTYYVGVWIDGIPCGSPGTEYVDIYADGKLVRTDGPGYPSCCQSPCYFSNSVGTYRYDPTAPLDHFLVTPQPGIIGQLSSAIIDVTPLNVYYNPITIDPSTLLSLSLDNEGSQLGSFRNQGSPSGSNVTSTLALVNGGGVTFVSDGQMTEGNALINVSGASKTGSGTLLVRSCSPKCTDVPIQFTLSGQRVDNQTICGSGDFGTTDPGLYAYNDELVVDVCESNDKWSPRVSQVQHAFNYGLCPYGAVDINDAFQPEVTTQNYKQIIIDLAAARDYFVGKDLLAYHPSYTASHCTIEHELAHVDQMKNDLEKAINGELSGFKGGLVGRLKKISQPRTFPCNRDQAINAMTTDINSAKLDFVNDWYKHLSKLEKKIIKNNALAAVPIYERPAVKAAKQCYNDLIIQMRKRFE